MVTKAKYRAVPILPPLRQASSQHAHRTPKAGLAYPPHGPFVKFVGKIYLGRDRVQEWHVHQGAKRPELRFHVLLPEGEAERLALERARVAYFKRCCIWYHKS